MSMTDTAICDILERQRAFYRTGATRDIGYRKLQLNALLDMVRKNEDAILDALHTDLNKPRFEAYGSEVGLLRAEIKNTLRQLNRWAKPRRMPVHITQLPSTTWIYPEPYGVALIIAPWNYPFLLIIAPLVGAIAAGNCAILKPSELAPATSALTAKLIAETFDPAFVAAIEGGHETAQALLAEKFDYIFYTGNSRVGRLVMQAAARNLTPVTLELGGKSPCIVDADADIDTTARRIIWGKYFNAGQVCISPDYVLVDERVKPALLKALTQHIHQAYNGNPKASPDYCRIINQAHFERLSALIPTHPEDGTVVAGAETEATTRFIAPTIIDEPSLDGPLMQDEIFGPLLPVVSYKSFDEAIDFLNARPKPLALYFFSRNKALQNRILLETSSGGGCINDVILHFSSPILPFGGVGESGMGKYRGRSGFDTFTHEKAFMKRSALFDIWFRYAPYKHSFAITKWLL